MAILTVGPTLNYPTIKKAMLAAQPGDSIVLEMGYTNEIATVIHDGMYFGGHASNTGIKLITTVPYIFWQAPVGVEITGNAAFNSINGYWKDDTLRGAGGNDDLGGYGGNDTLLGGAGDDRLWGGNSDAGIPDNDYLDGGDGHDTAWFDNASGPIKVSLGISGPQTIGADGGIDTLINIESVVGSVYGDVLTGNARANGLYGNGGNDTLNGGSGADTLAGGNGDDTLIVNEAGNQVRELAGQGTDTVLARVSYTLAAGQSVEIMRVAPAAATTAIDLTGNEIDNQLFGNAGANRLAGAGGNDRLAGNAGDDTLDGGVGRDTMGGGAGNDTYVVDDPGDRTNETVGQGTDTVRASVSWALAANVEELLLLGSANLNGKGNAGPNRLTGNAGNNKLDGRAGADTLDGGAGNDTLTGGTEADVFRFARTNAGADRIADFNQAQDRFDLAGGAFTSLKIAPNGDTILTHDGGTVRVTGVGGLSLSQWNALVLPGGQAAAVPFAGEAFSPPAADALATLLAPGIVGDWFFA